MATQYADLYRPGDEQYICGCSNLDHRGFVRAQASFPPSCRLSVGIYIDWRKFPDGRMGITRERFHQAFLRAIAEWNAHVGIRFYLEPDVEKALAYVDFANLAGTVLAWSHLADGTCRDDKQQRYDIRNWTPHLAFLTILHELGHLLGLVHKNGPYVMNPTILTGLNGLTTDDIRRARNLGYGEPETPGPPEPPAPPEPPSPPEEPPKMPWDKIIELVLVLIKECGVRDGEEAVFQRLRDPGLREAVLLRRAAKTEGLRGRELRKTVRRGMDDLRQASDDEIRAFIADAQA